MARARSGRTMSMEELSGVMDEQAPWPPEEAYVGDGGQSDYEMHAAAARRRIRVALRLGVVDRFVIHLASHWRDPQLREGEKNHGP